MTEKSMDIVLVIPRHVYTKHGAANLSKHNWLRSAGITVGSSRVIPSASGTSEMRLSNLKGITWEDIQRMSSKTTVRVMGNYVVGNDVSSALGDRERTCQAKEVFPSAAA